MSIVTFMYWYTSQQIGGETVDFVVRGAPSADLGSECNAHMPTGASAAQRCSGRVPAASRAPM